MVAREDAQMVSGLVAQAVVVVCVEPHKYGGTTAKATRDLRNPFQSISFCPHNTVNRMKELENQSIGAIKHYFTSL